MPVLKLYPNGLTGGFPHANVIQRPRSVMSAKAGLSAHRGGTPDSCTRCALLSFRARPPVRLSLGYRPR